MDGRPNGRNKAAFSNFSCALTVDATLAQAYTNKPVTGDVGKITIGVKGHASEIPISGRCAEVW